MFCDYFKFTCACLFVLANFNDSFTIECEEAFVALANSPAAEERISFVVDNLQCQSVYVTSNNSQVKVSSKREVKDDKAHQCTFSRVHLSDHFSSDLEALETF